MAKTVEGDLMPKSDFAQLTIGSTTTDLMKLPMPLAPAAIPDFRPAHSHPPSSFVFYTSQTRPSPIPVMIALIMPSARSPALLVTAS